jgi:hypothetical protein
VISVALVDCLGPDAEKGSDGDLGQRQALLQGGGQESVGQGQDRAAAGAGSGLPRAVAAALVQARLPLLVMQGNQRADQGVSFPGPTARSAPSGRARPGPDWAGRTDRGRRRPGRTPRGGGCSSSLRASRGGSAAGRPSGGR